MYFTKQGLADYGAEKHDEFMVQMALTKKKKKRKRGRSMVLLLLPIPHSLMDIVC